MEWEHFNPVNPSGVAVTIPIKGFFHPAWLRGMIVRGQWALFLQSIELDCEFYNGPEDGPLSEILVAEGECSSVEEGKALIEQVVTTFWVNMRTQSERLFEDEV